MKRNRFGCHGMPEEASHKLQNITIKRPPDLHGKVKDQPMSITSNNLKGPDAAEISQRRSRVLIVENSPVMRKIINDVFTGLSRMEVVGLAGDGVEALEAIQRLQPDLLVMDIQMPRMGGLEVLKPDAQGAYAG